jgi:hypothetical protein
MGAEYQLLLGKTIIQQASWEEHEIMAFTGKWHPT